MNEARFGRLILGVAAVCGVLLAVEAATALRVALDDGWNDARLAPTVALLRGIPLWAPHGEGPLLNRVYGAVGVVAWLPAAVQSTPVRAITVGLVEALLVTLLPVFWILRVEARHHPTLVAATFLLAVAFILSTPVLPGVGIHVDALALGLSTAALACAWTERRRQHTGWRWAGAALAVAAVHSKQVMVPLLVAYPAWIALASGRRQAVRASLAVGSIAVASLGLVALTVDIEAMVFGTVAGPLRQPWQRADPFDALSWASLDLVRRSIPAVALLAVAALLAGRQAGTWRELARSNRWVFPLVVGVACVPTALLGRVKTGGAPNTLAPTIWFIWLGMLAAYASASRSGPVIRRTLTAVALVAACALAVRLAPTLEDLPRLLRERPLPSVAFDAARQAPGTIYFPYRSLVSLMAEGRADHLSWAMFFRELEGRVVDDRYLQAFLPPQLERIAIERRWAPHDMLTRLPQFRRQVMDPSLPGWIVLKADDALAPGEVPAPFTTEERSVEALPAGVLDWPGSPVRLHSPRLTVAERDERLHVRVDVETGQTHAAEDLDLEVLLRDEANGHLLTLAAVTRRDASGHLAFEWPVLREFVWPAARGLVLVRSGRQDGNGTTWRLPAEQLRSLVRDAVQIR